MGKTAERTLERFAERVEESTRTHLAGAESLVSSSARLIGAQLLDATDDQALTRYFHVKMETYPWISSMTLGRFDGSSVHVRRELDVVSPSPVDIGAKRQVPPNSSSASVPESNDHRRSPSGRDGPREQPWYRAALGSDDPAWIVADAYPGKGAIPGIVVALERGAKASSEDAAVAGVLAVGLELKTLSSTLSTVPGASRGSAMLIEPSGRVVAYSDPDRFTDAKADKGTANLADLDDGLLERLFERYHPRIATSDIATMDLEPLLVDRRQHLAVVRAFPVGLQGVERAGPDHPDRAAAADGPWILIAQVPFDRYTGVVQERFERRLITLVAVLALSSLVAVFAVLRLTRPIYHLHRDATVDSLTGVCNRAEFVRRVGARTGNARHGDGTMVLVVFDLDGFKEINDTHGHAAGDAVLVTFAQRLRSRLRSPDIVGRLGGDEFALALDIHGLAADDVAVIEQIRADATCEPIRFADKRLVFGATAGIAHRLSGESVAATLERADRALVAGKIIAKNRTYAWLAPEEQKDRVDDALHVTRAAVAKGVVPGGWQSCSSARIV